MVGSPGEELPRKFEAYPAVGWVVGLDVLLVAGKKGEGGCVPPVIRTTSFMTCAMTGCWEMSW